jgi:outer membrane protein assembly factor BamB
MPDSDGNHPQERVTIKDMANSPWPCYRGNAKHTGLSPYDTSKSNGTLRWLYWTGGSISSSPTIGIDGTIYIGSSDFKLYALNPDGTLKWSYLTGGNVFSSPTIGSDGTIYVGSNDKNLYALNPNGTLKWSHGTGDAVITSPAIGSDGTIYFGSYDHNLYALNPNGTLKWSYGTGDVVASSPAIGDDGTIYFGSYDDNMYALNPNGTLKWSYPTGGEIYTSSPAIGGDGTIYVGNWGNGNLYAFNPNGTLRWSFGIGGFIYSSPAIGGDGTIYVGSTNNNLRAVNPNGTSKWSYAVGSGMSYSSPAIGSDGTIYVGSNKLYAVNPNGSLKWSYAAGSGIPSSPAIDEYGTIYVGSYDHGLYALGYPTVSITSPTIYSVYLTNWGQMKLIGTASDDVAVTNVTWVNNRGGSGTAYMTPQYGNFSVSWQSRGNVQLFTGVNVITVAARDAAGNVGTKVLTVTYDNVAPACTITSPTTNPTYSTNSATINLSGSASDANGIATVVWKNKGTGASGTCTGNVSWSQNGIALNLGMNLIYVNATDYAGNKKSDAIWVTYSIDTLAVTITDPTGNSTMTTGWHMILLKGTASDDVKVTSVTWTNSLGGSGIAYMTPQWGGASITWQSRGNVMLSSGDNVITITAYDSAGNSKTDVLTVTYTGP